MEVIKDQENLSIPTRQGDYYVFDYVAPGKENA